MYTEFNASECHTTITYSEPYCVAEAVKAASWAKYYRNQAKVEAARKASIAAEASKPQPVSAPETTVKCSCGHSVARSMVMNASTGTACPNCYDRMS